VELFTIALVMSSKDFAVHPAKPRKIAPGVWENPVVDVGREHRRDPRVIIFRTVFKEVSEYEAEILCRNGWQRETSQNGS